MAPSASTSHSPVVRVPVAHVVLIGTNDAPMWAADPTAATAGTGRKRRQRRAPQWRRGRRRDAAGGGAKVVPCGRCLCPHLRSGWRRGARVRSRARARRWRLWGALVVLTARRGGRGRNLRRRCACRCGGAGGPAVVLVVGGAVGVRILTLIIVVAIIISTAREGPAKVFAPHGVAEETRRGE